MQESIVSVFWGAPMAWSVSTPAYQRMRLVRLRVCVLLLVALVPPGYKYMGTKKKIQGVQCCCLTKMGNFLQ
jgi:hypothetical protein